MSEILETSFPIPEQIADIPMEKIGDTIESETCIIDNTKTNDGVICYV